MSYYIDYINFIINHNETKVRNPPNVLDLKKVYSKLKIGKHKKITIQSVEICSNSMGCPFCSLSRSYVLIIDCGDDYTFKSFWYS